MERLSDGELLQLADDVDRQSARLDELEAMRPDPMERQGLAAECSKLDAEIQTIVEKCREQLSVIETLGPCRSIWYPFGTPKKQIDLEKTRFQAMRRAGIGKWDERESKKAKLEELNKRETAYREGIAPYVHLVQAREDLVLEPVRERLERIRQEHQRQREMQQEVYRMARWREVAEAIGQPQKYLDRIDEVTKDVEQGQPLSERARNARAEDDLNYQSSLLSQPKVFDEINWLIRGLRSWLQKYGQYSPDGWSSFDGQTWRVRAKWSELELVRQRDGVTVLSVGGKTVERYCPTPSEREHLSNMVSQVMKQTRQQRRGLSR